MQSLAEKFKLDERAAYKLSEAGTISVKKGPSRACGHTLCLDQIDALMTKAGQLKDSPMERICLRYCPRNPTRLLSESAKRAQIPPIINPWPFKGQCFML